MGSSLLREVYPHGRVGSWEATTCPYVGHGCSRVPGYGLWRARPGQEGTSQGLAQGPPWRSHAEHVRNHAPHRCDGARLGQPWLATLFQERQAVGT